MCKFTVSTQGAAAAQLLERLQTKRARTEEHMCVHGAQTHVRAHRRIYRWPIYAGSDHGRLLANTVGTVSFSAQPVGPLMRQLLLRSPRRREEEALIDC